MVIRVRIEFGRPAIENHHVIGTRLNPNFGLLDSRMGKEVGLFTGLLRNVLAQIPGKPVPSARQRRETERIRVCKIPTDPGPKEFSRIFGKITGTIRQNALVFI